MIDFSLISTRLGILALGLKELAVLLQGHSKVLLSAELIGKSSSINHGSGSLFFRELSLTAHLIKVSINCAELIFQLPLSSSNSLVLVGQISQSLIGVSQLLFKASSRSVSLLKHGSSFFKAILHSSSLPISIDLSILSSSLQLRLFINLDLCISDLVLVLLDSSLSLQSSSISMLQSQIKICYISLQFLLHSQSLSLALGFSLKSNLHRLKGL